jgi:hypothetical protein
MAADPKRKEEDWSKSEEYKNVSLSDDDNKYFDNLLQSSKAKQDKFTQELINKYQDYATQRLDIEKKFNDDIALLQDQRIKAEKAGNKEMVEQINKAISKAVANKGKELISFDFDILKESPEYIRAFEDLKNTSTETLNSLLQQLEQAKSAASSTLDPSELREYTSTIQSIMDELSNRNPFEALVKAKEELALADEELAKAKADLDSTLNGTPVVKSIKIDSSTGKLVKEYLSLNEAIKKYNKALDKQKDKENEVVESRDKVLKSIGKLADAIEELGDSVGGEIGEIISLIGNISNVVLISVAAVNTVKKTAESTMSAVESASVILMVISAVIQIATKVASLLAGKHDKKKEAEIQSLQAKVDALKDSYDKLSKAIDKAYAADAADLIRQQNENLKQQKQILEEQIRLEEEKKKTDNDKVQGYKDAIKEIDETIEGSGERMIEAIIGKDISSAIDDFAEAYADAWAAGEDKAASMKEVVRKMIKSAVAELIKSRLAPEVTAFMTKLAEVMEDGIITVEEQMDLDYLESRIYNKLDGLDAGLDKYVKDKQEESREASSKGFESMSQDSADELNGRFTAMQALVSSITENTKILVANSGQMLQHLAGIESNTEACRRLDGMDSDLKAVKDSINHIALKGIIIKN